MNVAVLGTGIMGAGMSRSLLRAGHAVTVWNRTTAKAAPLADDGATVAETPAEAVAGAEVVIVMLFDTAAVLDVLTAVGPTEAVVLQTSTIGQEGMLEVAALAAGRELKLVDAPVLGTKGPAEQGKLIALLSGDPALIGTAQPAIDGYAARSVNAGPDLGAASALKLVCNAWISTVNAAVGQSYALAVGLGIDPALFPEAIKGGAADNQYLHMKTALIAEDDYPASFTLDGAVKDVELILAAARKADVGDDVLAGLTAVYRRATDAGHGEKDMAAVYRGF